MTETPGVNYKVRHVTEIRYDALVNLARFNLRLKPADWPGQTLLAHRIEISPPPRTMIEDTGPFITCVSRLMLDKPTNSLAITSEFTVAVDRPEIAADMPCPTLAEVRAEAQASRSLSAADPSAYVFPSPLALPSAELSAWAESALAPKRPTLAAAAGLMQRIHDEFTYDSKATKADTTPLEAFRKRRGVCQDFAHVMIVALRHFGVPAAYVSGYLRTNPPPGRPRLVGADATHAWVNVWCGRAIGWVGFDPTNAVIVANDHIFTAMGRDYTDVSPVDGVFIGRAGQRMKVSVEVSPLSAPDGSGAAG